MQTATYSPDIFNVRNIDEAKQIILTPEDGLTSAQRWEREAPYLLSLMEPMGLNENSVVLDYGCGIGRLSKALIEKYGCHVVGADISASMRAFAAAHVGSPRFLACAPEMIDRLGIQFDGALSVWVLQHCFKPQDDIARIKAHLKASGQLFVVNETVRVVPTKEVGWVNDGGNIGALLSDNFNTVCRGQLDPGVVTLAVTERTFWSLFES